MISVRMKTDVSFLNRRSDDMEHSELMRELNRILAYLFDDEPKKKEVPNKT